VQRTGASSQKGTPFVDVQLRVIEGPRKNRVAFIRQFLSNPMDDAVYQQIARGKGGSADELDQKSFKFYNMTSGFVKSLGVAPQQVDPGQFPSSADASVAFWNVKAWEGQKFVAGISVETAESQIEQAKNRGGEIPQNPSDRNQLRSYYPLDQEQLEKLRNEEFPKQEAQENAGGGKTVQQDNVPKTEGKAADSGYDF
jgi:hypothetical protein